MITILFHTHVSAYFEYGSFHRLDKQLKQISGNMKLSEAIIGINQWLLPHGKTGVFLMVDNLSVGEGDHVGCIAQQIGCAMDGLSVTEFNALVTLEPDGHIHMSSDCPIVRVPLRLATPEESLELFPIENKAQEIITKYFVMLAGGNFETLVRGRRSWREWFRFSISSLTMGTILDWAHSGNDVAPSVELLEAAMLGECYGPKDLISLRTLGQWKEMGVCAHSSQSDDALEIPTIKLLTLYSQCLQETSIPELAALLNVSVPELPMEPEDTLYRQLEIFHIHWENLRRSLLKRKNTRRSLMRIPKSRTSSLISLRTARTVFTRHYGLELDEHTLQLGLPRISLLPKLGVKTLTTSLADFFAGLTELGELLDYLHLGQFHNNDSVDACYLEVGPNKQLVFVGVDNKFSRLHSASKIKAADIQRKVDNLVDMLFPNGITERVFTSGKDKYTLSKKNVVVVFASFQHLPKKYSKKMKKLKWPRNVIMLGRKRLKKLYTPTFTTSIPVIRSAETGEVLPRR